MRYLTRNTKMTAQDQIVSSFHEQDLDLNDLASFSRLINNQVKTRNHTYEYGVDKRNPMALVKVNIQPLITYSKLK